jgi:hypothetical protein
MAPPQSGRKLARFRAKNLENKPPFRAIAADCCLHDYDNVSNSVKFFSRGMGLAFDDREIERTGPVPQPDGAVRIGWRQRFWSIIFGGGHS